MNPRIALITSAELNQQPRCAETELARDFFDSLLQEAPSGPSSLVKNVTTRAQLLQVGDHVFPITCNEDNLTDSWVCSPYNAVAIYPLEELRNLDSAILRSSLAALVHAIAPALRWAQVNRTVCVNNWLLSTNLYPEIDRPDVHDVTALFCKQYPGHSLMWRSLNEVSNRDLLESLKGEGYLLAPSRQVYMFDGTTADYLSRHNTKIDRKLLKATHYTRVDHDDFSSDDDARIRELYDMLYLRKYSFQNPHFSEQLISIWRRSRLVRLFGLRNPSGRLDAVVGTFSRHNVVTAPLVGYDTTLKPSTGLYRMLMAYVLELAADEKMMLNLSAGAGEFKRLRGGKATVEFSAVHVRHLPWRQQFVWKALAMILEQVGVRILRQYQL